jgi:hypothetical protein
VVPLGAFSLNLVASPGPHAAAWVATLARVVQALCPAAHAFPMSLENMNTIPLVRFYYKKKYNESLLTKFGGVQVPRKDNAANRLRTGLLQLAAGTHLLLDETALLPGQLNARGVANVRALEVGRLYMFISRHLIRYCLGAAAVADRHVRL